MAGLWCTSLGWGNAELADVTRQQMLDLSYYHGFTGRLVPVAEELAEKLVALAPGRLKDNSRVFFGMSGSDANDTQVRMLWHYNHIMGRPKKRKLISRHRGYHGVTVASGSLTGLPYVHTAQGLPLDFVAAHVTCPSYYRQGREGESEADFVQRLAAELEDAIEAAGGASEVAAFIAEPLQGAGGVVLPPTGYFEAVGRVCRKHEVLMVGDEVITGFGRTGQFWGADAFGQQTDLLSCAKQLTSGYIPLSAAILPADMCDAMEAQTARSGSVFGHGYTYTSHPVACAVALKVLEIMERDGLVDNVRQRLGPLFQARLAKLAAHPLVGEARGVGLIGGLELVSDQATKKQFAPGVAPKVVQSALDHGLIVRALAGDVIALCPPLVITPNEVNEVFDKLEAALDDVLKKVKVA
jgi:4-aminobutyrate---pyruvate transaminase